MKSITQNIFGYFLSSLLVFGIACTVSGQTASKSDQTITMLVPGICGMCKERIETTAMDVAGVKKAEWNMETDTLIVIGSSKMDKQKIAEALAKAGYRSDVCAADPKAYNKLPGCCQYDSGLKKH